MPSLPFISLHFCIGEAFIISPHKSLNTSAAIIIFPHSFDFSRDNKYLLAGSGYMSLARYKASDELRNRYYLYATGTYSAGRFTLSVRERFQSTYKVHAEHPKNYLRSMLTLSYKIGKSGFCPFAYTEVFNDTRNKMRSDKIRFSTGSNYQLNPNNNLQLYYRYHIFNVDDPVNYRHAIGICYTHRF